VSLGVERFLEINRSLRLLQTLLDILDGDPVLVKVVLNTLELLNLDEDLLRRRKTSGKLRRGVVDVSVVSDAAHADGGIVGATLGDGLRRCDEDVAEDVLESASRSLVVVDEVEGEFSSVLASGSDTAVVGLVDLQRGDGKEDRLRLDRLGLDESGDGLAVSNGDVVETATGSDFEGGGGGSVGLRKVDKTGEGTEDGGAVEAGVRVVGAEIDTRDFAALLLATL
jgi:hypothetical protein